MMLYSLAKKNFMFIAVFAGILRAKFPSLLKRDGNAIAFPSRAIARDGVKTHFIFYSLCKRFPDNQMFMYKQRIKRLTIPPKEIFELTLTLHIRKTFIFLFHF